MWREGRIAVLMWYMEGGTIMNRVSGRVALLLSIGVVIMIGGCGKDNPVSSSQPLVGTWELVSVNGNPFDEDESFRLTFNANGTFSASDGDAGTYTIDGDTITLKGFGSENSDPPVTFSISGNTLTITDDFLGVLMYTRV